MGNFANMGEISANPMEVMMFRPSSSWRPFVVVVSLSLLAACAFPPNRQFQTDASSSAAPVPVTQTSAGSVMTTPSGMTLYTYDLDTAGRSNCNGECTQYWHPLTADQGASQTRNMTLITREEVLMMLV